MWIGFDKCVPPFCLHSVFTQMRCHTAGEGGGCLQRLHAMMFIRQHSPYPSTGGIHLQRNSCPWAPPKMRRWQARRPGRAAPGTPSSRRCTRRSAQHGRHGGTAKPVTRQRCIYTSTRALYICSRNQACAIANMGHRHGVYQWCHSKFKCRHCRIPRSAQYRRPPETSWASWHPPLRSCMRCRRRAW